MVKPIVAVDIDDVLSKTAEGFVAYSNKLWNAGITADDYTEKWAIAWNIPESEAVQQLKRCNSAAEAGTPSTLFGPYKWNTQEFLPKDVTRAHNWL